MSLQPGNLFWYANPRFPTKNHPHVVVGITPEGYIIYVAISTNKKVVSKFSGKPPNFVIIPASKCSALEQESYVNCEQVFDTFEKYLVMELSYKFIDKTKLDSDLLHEICDHIRNSKTASNRMLEHLCM